MRCIVTGSRSIEDYAWVKRKLDRLFAKTDKSKLTILHGGCKEGVDKLADRWCYENRIAREVYHADWNEHGKAGGPIRNTEMVEAAGKSAWCVAMWDGVSRGTADCMTKARKAGLKMRVIYYEENE